MFFFPSDAGPVLFQRLVPVNQALQQNGPLWKLRINTAKRLHGRHKKLCLCKLVETRAPAGRRRGAGGPAPPHRLSCAFIRAVKGAAQPKTSGFFLPSVPLFRRLDGFTLSCSVFEELMELDDPLVAYFLDRITAHKELRTYGGSLSVW